MTSVKDQKSCGSCADFAAVATIDTCMWRVNSKYWPLIGQYWSRDLNTGLWLDQTLVDLVSYWYSETWHQAMCLVLYDKDLYLNLYCFRFIQFLFAGPGREGVQHPPRDCLHRPLRQCLVDEASLPAGKVCDHISCHPSSLILWQNMMMFMMLWRLIMWHLRAVMKTPEQGGDTLVHAVMDSDLVTRGSGLQLENHRWHAVIASWIKL